MMLMKAPGPVDVMDTMRLRGRSDCEIALAAYDLRIGPSRSGIANACLASLAETSERMRDAGTSMVHIAAYAGSYREAIRRSANTIRHRI